MAERLTQALWAEEVTSKLKSGGFQADNLLKKLEGVKRERTENIPFRRSCIDEAQNQKGFDYVDKTENTV